MKKFLIGIIASLILIPVVVVSTEAVTFPLTSTYDFITTDNGMQGPWATDYFHSNVTITPTEQEDCYEVVREDSGTFEVLPGSMSPGGEDGSLVGDGTVGTISGGLTDIVCGILRESPLPNDTSEDLREGSYNSYEDKYFHRYFSEIRSGNITAWGWTYSTCNNGTWVDNEETESIYNGEGPNAQMGDITGEYVPCQTPTTDVCANIEGNQTSVPDGYLVNPGSTECRAFQYGGPPPPAEGAVLAGQVLGATTLGATGVTEEQLFLVLFTLGSILVGTGVKKLGVPKK